MSKNEDGTENLGALPGSACIDVANREDVLLQPRQNQPIPESTLQSVFYVDQHRPDPFSGGTTAMKMESWRRFAQTLKPEKMPTCSMLLALPCTAQPVALDVQNRAPRETPFLSMEVLDALVANLTTSGMYGFCSSSLRESCVPPRGRRVWLGAGRVVGNVGHAMQQVWQRLMTAITQF